jgi:hypothetical protein
MGHVLKTVAGYGRMAFRSGEQCFPPSPPPYAFGFEWQATTWTDN